MNIAQKERREKRGERREAQRHPSPHPSRLFSSPLRPSKSALTVYLPLTHVDSLTPTSEMCMK